jgi:glycosyltransferase involved in cell wall biosynthesis
VRVLCVIDSLAPGGAEISLSAMAPLLTGSGIELHVAYLHERKGLRQRFIDAGVPTYPLPGPGIRLRLAQLRAMISNLHPDIVHTTLAESDLLGRLAGWLEHVPVVSSLVNVQYGPEHRSDPLASSWKLLCWQLADIITAQSVRRFHAVGVDVADVMARRLAVRRRLIDVVPRGRDPDALGKPSEERRRRARQSLGVDGSEVVLAVGRHAYQKGFDLLLEAFADVAAARPHVRLLIAGSEGPQTTAIKAQILRGGLGSQVHLLGHRDDIPELLSATDLFVLPSRREGSPGALIEAMAMALPCLASDIPAVREVAGVPPAVSLVEAGSASRLADEIARLLGHTKAARELGVQARNRFIDEYTLASAVVGIVNFYRRALSGAARAVS